MRVDQAAAGGWIQVSKSVMLLSDTRSWLRLAPKRFPRNTETIICLSQRLTSAPLIREPLVNVSKVVGVREALWGDRCQIRQVYCDCGSGVTLNVTWPKKLFSPWGEVDITALKHKLTCEHREETAVKSQSVCYTTLCSCVFSKVAFSPPVSGAPGPVPSGPV